MFILAAALSLLSLCLFRSSLIVKQPGTPEVRSRAKPSLWKQRVETNVIVLDSESEVEKTVINGNEITDEPEDDSDEDVQPCL